MSGVVTFLKKVWRIIIDFFWPPDPYDKAFDSYSAYLQTKNFEDLATSIEYYGNALQLRRKSKDPNDLASLLANYAVALWSCYKAEPAWTEITKRDYMKESIKFNEEARQLWKDKPPADSQSLYPTLLTNLANAYLELSLLDPSKAITSLTESLVLNREVFNNSSYPEDIRYTAAFRIGEVLWACYELKTKKPQTQFPDEVDGAGRVTQYIHQQTREL